MPKNPLDILYQDDYLFVVNKTAGLLSVPDRHDAKRPSVKQLLRQATSQAVYPVHRLDADTSGVMIVARTPEAQRILSEQFAQHTPQKVYHALVEGIPAPALGTIDHSIAPASKPGRMRVHASGKRAITNYRLTESFRRFSWLTVEIETGRTHQIRVHLQALGHPLVADPFYGRRSALRLSDVKGKRFQLAKGTTERPLLQRTALHATSITFQHPDPSRIAPVQFSAPLPKDLRASLQQLRKWDTPPPIS
ncbi:MAG: RluA family pseudouridine synthase [Bacteroidota bacterium]